MKLNFFQKLLLIFNVLTLLFQLMLMGSIPSLFDFSILNLFVPLVVIINIAFFLYWLLRSKWVFLLFMIAFLIGYGEWGLLYQFPRNLIHKSTDTFKVMTYNVRLFNKFDWIEGKDIPAEIKRFLDNEQPDVICFQEYSKSEAPKLPSYPYSYVQPIQSNGKSEIAIFSKFPINNTGYINFENSTNSGIFTDIQYRGKKARVYNLHLESLRINFKDTLITNRNSEGLQLKFNQVFKKQLDQIGQFEKIDKQNPFPSIVCTDLNNSQFSVIYRALKKDKNDVFKEAGTGLGTTFNFSFFPLRIDFILTDAIFKINGFKSYDIELSDHLPIMTTLAWE
ncbi:MAG: endonuclease/exonuclease/phosphatase family protein [Flavobacteriaceae bacterium]|jgi:vancomycin resistance protein VanJ|nr:endonuclease/exonuclease/phosphatase family protein [Flavobacteriaceae bacterium]